MHRLNRPKLQFPEPNGVVLMQSRFREIFVMMARYADELHEPVPSKPKRSRLKHFLKMKDRLPRTFSIGESTRDRQLAF